jgi:anti-sigma factor RsiW
MNEHISQWLNAYHDGELRPRRRALVEAHLEACPQCQAELDELQALSALLNEEPLPAVRTTPEQFAAQVALRLPRQEPRRQNGTNFRWLWYAVPISILVAFGFLRTITTVSELLLWVERLGINPDTVSWVLPDPILAADTAPGLVSQFSGWILWWNNPFRSPLALSLLIPAALAIGYLAWMMLWWAEQNQDENNNVGVQVRR